MGCDTHNRNTPPAAITRLDLPDQLRGLMAIPEHTSDEAVLAAQMRRMQALFTELARQYPSVDTLSMGMTEDLEAAVAHGSTMVRVGTAIFGARDDS